MRGILVEESRTIVSLYIAASAFIEILFACLQSVILRLINYMGKILVLA